MNANASSVVQALNDAAILDDRTSSTGRLALRGADTEAFLQGVLSQDMKALAPGGHALSFLLTPKGAIIAILRILRLGPSEFLAAADATAVARAFATLERFVITEDVAVRDESAEFATLSLRGGKALEIASALVPRSEALDPGRFATAGDAIALRADEPGLGIGVDLVLPRSRAASAKETLSRAGARAIDAGAAEGLRVEAGIPRCGKDLDETSLGPESRLEERAVSYTKGCYVGQETIARLKTYGAVNRMIVGLLFEGDPAKEGDSIAVDGKDVGRVTTVAMSPRLGRPAALGLLRREHVAPGTRVAAGRASAVVAALPLVS